MEAQTQWSSIIWPMNKIWLVIDTTAITWNSNLKTKKVLLVQKLEWDVVDTLYTLMYIEFQMVLRSFKDNMFIIGRLMSMWACEWYTGLPVIHHHNFQHITKEVNQ